MYSWYIVEMSNTVNNDQYTYQAIKKFQATAIHNSLEGQTINWYVYFAWLRNRKRVGKSLVITVWSWYCYHYHWGDGHRHTPNLIWFLEATEQQSRKYISAFQYVLWKHLFVWETYAEVWKRGIDNLMSKSTKEAFWFICLK